MKALAFALVLLMMSGCFGQDADEERCVGGDCSSGSQEQVRHAVLESCVLTAFTVELPQEAFELPTGFTSRSGGIGAQLLAVVVGRCANVRIGEVSETDISFGQAGILVEAPDRGQSSEFDVFDLEVYTDSPSLASLLEAIGLPIVQSTVSTTDSGPLRHTAIQGGAVDYQILAEFLPVEGATNDITEAHHSATSWAKYHRACQYYEATAPVQLVPAEGRLTEASFGAPLSGRGSQTVACDIELSLP